MIQWVQDLLDIEQRESRKRYILNKHNQSIFELLRKEVDACVEQCNQARIRQREDADKFVAAELGAEGNEFTITVAVGQTEKLKLAYDINNGQLHFGKRKAIIDLEEVPAELAPELEKNFAAVFSVDGNRIGRIPEIVEYILKPILFATEIISKLPPKKPMSFDSIVRDTATRAPDTTT